MSKEKVIINLCSSDEEVSDDENYCEETDVEDEEDTILSEDDSDWNAVTESDVEYDLADENGDKDDDDEKVTRLLKAGSDLKALNLKECKAYLRKHGLRLSGTKAVCIDRIAEHWRIKDGRGEVLYPRSSFTINCKGDVCKGDTVLFTQKVHHKYEKMKKSGKIMGRRTVAGQVVKESYGTAKQQHTFTIEVLWCQGTQILPPLYPLLVKGRNLYKLMTLRQRWGNEADRLKVLSEKHNRGAAARKIMRERKVKLGYVFKDGRLQKPDHMKKPCKLKTRKNANDENLIQKSRQDIPAKNPNQLGNMGAPNSYTSHSSAPRPHVLLTYGPRPHAPLTYAPRSYAPYNAPQSHFPRPNIPPYQSYTYQTNQRPPQVFYYRRPASNALQGQAFFNPPASTDTMPVTHQGQYQNHHTRPASSNSGYNLGVRDLNRFSDMTISQRTEGGTYRQSEATRRPYENHFTDRWNPSNGYGREGDTRRTNYR